MPDLTEHDAQLVPLDSLKPYRGNPRRGNVGVIRESLRENGQYRPVVVRAKTREVLAGNHTLEAARQEEWSEIWATFVDCDAKAARRIVLVDNRSNDLAEYDQAELASLLEELKGQAEGTGWSEREMISFVAKVNGPGEDTEPGEVPVKPRSKLGDLWVLGEHRLLCGDATVAGDVEKLTDGGTAQLMATDPPYGVALDQTWRDRIDGVNGMGKGRAGKVANDDRADWREAWLLTDAPVAYVWHGALHSPEVYESLTVAGFEVRQQIVWVKTMAPMGRSAYHWKHEPCWYAVRRGAAAHWHGGRQQTTIWEAAAPNHIMGGSHEEKTLHPTQKPLVLFERPIENHTDAGALVYDPFAGSGTTLIACENLSRRCYAMEIDPGYVDVCVDRWERHTGQKATLAPTGDREPPSGKGRKA